MSYQINDLKAGLTVIVDNEVFMIIGVDHVKPGKGAAFARTKLKNLRLGTVLERTFRTSDTIEEAFIEARELQFSYRAGAIYHFLDQSTFEDIAIDEGRLGDSAKFLKDNIVINAYYHKHELVNIVLPSFVSYKIVQAEPGFKGDTAKGTGKPAVIESGATIQVPLFVNVGDMIKVDTRTGTYIERAYQ